MARCRLSVAMCTYNGDRFVKSQLESIAGQTYSPDELVVYDDASTDTTLQIVREFARRAPFPVRLTVNRERIGSTLNFQNAIAAAEGEIIVLSDQDDIWAPEKLARIQATFAAWPDVRCVFSDAEVTDERLQPLGYRLWQSVRFDRRKQQRMVTRAGLDVLLQQNVVTGATMALRADLRDLILPIPAGWVQDGWIALLAAAVGTCLPLNEPLVRYRQHATQQIGGLKRTLIQQVAVARTMDGAFFGNLAQNYQAARDRLATSRSHRCSETVLHKLDGKVAHCLRRIRIREDRWRLALILGEALSGRYHRYSLGWKSIASDLFL